MTSTIVTALLFDGLFAAGAAIGFCLISNPQRNAIPICALLAAIGHALRYWLTHYFELDIATASFIAAFSIGLLSIIFAKLIRCPAEVFSFPSLLPMIPGMYAYKTILGLVKFLKNTESDVAVNILLDVFKNGTTATFILFALVVGVAIPIFIFHKQSFSVTRNKLVGK